MGRLSTGLGFRMSQSLILVDALFLLDGGRRREGKKKRREKPLWGRRISQGLDLHHELQLLGAIKG
jgi:hypothetical protein